MTGSTTSTAAPAAVRADTVVLDIEGTTSPARYVVETMYPYSRTRFAAWIDAHPDDPDVGRALAQIAELTGLAAGDTGGVLAALNRWLDADEKVTPLKTLQGLIWNAGFQAGELTAPLYPDVAPALRAWVAAGARLWVYSSGSVAAQRAWFAHTTDGDLGGLLRGYFDTENAGAKQAPESYRAITRAIGAEPARTVFLSDRFEELDAARLADWATVGVCRPGEPYAARGVGDHLRVVSFDQIQLVRPTR